MNNYEDQQRSSYRAKYIAQEHTWLGRDLNIGHLLSCGRCEECGDNEHVSEVEHFGSIDILPDRIHTGRLGSFLFEAMYCMPSDRRIAPLCHGIERIENCWSAQKHSGVDSIVNLKVLAKRQY